MSAARIAVVLFGPEGRGSFNEAGLAGAQAARRAGHAVEVHWVAAPGHDARAQALARLCAAGLDLLVAHGAQGDLPVAQVSAAFPATRFAITQGSFVSPNTACYEVLQEQSAFLAGVFAGLRSRSGTVAHLSGEKVAAGLKGRAAFAHGVEVAGTGCRFLTAFIGDQHDPALAYRVTRELQRAGADLVFAMIDGGREGVSRACRELPLRQIGNVIDWVAREPEVFVASAVADSGHCVRAAIHDFSLGRLRPGTVTRAGLEVPACVRFVAPADLPDAHRATIAGWAAGVADGTLRPAPDYAGAEFDWSRAVT